MCYVAGTDKVRGGPKRGFHNGREDQGVYGVLWWRMCWLFANALWQPDIGLEESILLYSSRSAPIVESALFRIRHRTSQEESAPYLLGVLGSFI